MLMAIQYKNGIGLDIKPSVVTAVQEGEGELEVNSTFVVTGSALDKTVLISFEATAIPYQTNPVPIYDADISFHIDANTVIASIGTDDGKTIGSLNIAGIYIKELSDKIASLNVDDSWLSLEDGDIVLNKTVDITGHADSAIGVLGLTIEVDVKLLNPIPSDANKIFIAFGGLFISADPIPFHSGVELNITDDFGHLQTDKTFVMSQLNDIFMPTAGKYDVFISPYPYDGTDPNGILDKISKANKLILDNVECDIVPTDKTRKNSHDGYTYTIMENPGISYMNAQIVNVELEEPERFR